MLFAQPAKGHIQRPKHEAVPDRGSTLLVDFIVRCVMVGPEGMEWKAKGGEDPEPGGATEDSTIYEDKCDVNRFNTWPLDWGHRYAWIEHRID